MKFTIVAVSKHHKDALSDAIKEYCDRLKRGYSIKIINLKPASESAGGAEQKKKEAEKIMAALPSGKVLKIACDVKGKSIDTQGFAEKIRETGNQGVADIFFIIGGAFGLDESVIARSDFSLSLSPLTLSHRVALLLLTEQIYRAYTILTGHPYSK